MMPEIDKFLSKGRALAILHANADADAVGSGIALSLRYEIDLHAPSGISRVGKRLLEDTGIAVLDQVNFNDYDNIVVVDASSTTMLGIETLDWSKAIVIDHHSQPEKCEARLSVFDEDATSTCEMIWELLGCPEKTDEKTGLALLVGILGDTGHFHHATEKTLLNAAAIILASGVTIQDALALFEATGQDEISQKISRLKGGQRLKFERKGRWLVAASQVSSFESSVARGLLGLGADVAFVASQHKEEFRLTGRAKPSALKAGLHLGKMLEELAREVGGEGGGHDGAAGLSGVGDVEAMLNFCVKKALGVLTG